MKTIWTIWLIIAIALTVNAEGTKQLMPNNTGKCYVQFNESIGGQRYFAMSTNTDTLHRLFIHVANVGEVINVGFKKLASSTGDSKFRIKDASGAIVYAFTNIPTSGAGFISTFNEASIGPNTLNGGTGGYTPLSYTTTSTGDYYIEFEKTSSTSARYLFEYFDITVSSAANDAINGRVWSYAWDLNTEAFANSTYAVFNVYSTDKYITAINLNGMQPYSFVIACNNTGAQNTGDLFVDRQSVPNTNTTVPKYKIFLNTPDPLVYDVAVMPSMVEDLTILGTPTADQPVQFYINMTKGGTLEIFLDIDGDPGYQSDGRDVVLVKQINAGGDIITWDCKDGLGDPVTSTISVIVGSKFATGVTHLPVYDAEKNPNGFLVTRIAPTGPEDLVLYWDDSQINPGTIPAGQELVMLSGNTTANGHIWTTDANNSDGFGNIHTINTWWNGYEINNLSSFNFTLLPIELIKWDAIFKGTYVHLSWETASEKNNEIFNIQRSQNGKDWTTINTINGAGNSSNNSYYNDIDEYPLNGISYYRLQQVDYDGKNSFSRVVAVGTNTLDNKRIKIYSYDGFKYVSIEQTAISIEDINILDLNGKSVIYFVQMNKLDDSNVKINVTNLPIGTYILKTKDYSTIFYLY
jgi:hypothetical protein